MSEEMIPVDINILDKEYRIACPAGEESGLIEAAQFLTLRMRDIRDEGKIIGLERVAIMAALNIAHELLKGSGSSENELDSIESRLRGLQHKLEKTLIEFKQFEI